MKRAVAAWIIVVVLPVSALAQDTTEAVTNIIRLCAPSENLRLSLSGEIGGFIAKRLMGAEAEGKGEIIQDGRILERMIELRPDAATEIYGMYLNCVKPQLQRFIEAQPAAAARNIAPGESFALSQGSSVSLMDGSYHFAVQGVRLARDRKSIWKVKTVLSGPRGTRKEQLEFSENVPFHDKSCRVYLTGASADGQTFRFRLQCKQ